MKKFLVLVLCVNAVLLAGRFWQEASAERGRGGQDPGGPGDLNCDSFTDLSDAVYLLEHLFNGGPEPCFAQGGGLTAAQEAVLSKMRVEGDTLIVEGVNVQIVNGLGATQNGPNGLGNLIVGYQESRTSGADERTGSHNVIVGRGHNYTSYGGLVAGLDNTISGEWATVSGGLRNSATNEASSVSGGEDNVASGPRSWAAGGDNNEASGMEASVMGGSLNRATEVNATVSGGRQNTAGASQAAVSGGRDNLASGVASSVSGGRYNEARGDDASVSGGGGETPTNGNLAVGPYSSISGGEANQTGDPEDPSLGASASITGGRKNVATGAISAISGGWDCDTIGQLASVSGGWQNQAIGPRSSVSGGKANRTGDPSDLSLGDSSSVTGGNSNVALGDFSVVSAGRHNLASGPYSAVSGGGGASSTGGNVATSWYCTVSGGHANLAGFFLGPSVDHVAATVSGGRENVAQGSYSSVTGGQGSSALRDYECLGDSYSQPRFVDNGDGTVSDKWTGLMWQKDTDATPRNWTDSRLYCEDLLLAGHGDWRMPSLEELRSVVDETKSGPASDPVFGALSSFYWSSTSLADNPDAAWSVNFGPGGVNIDSKGIDLNVRAVRSGP